MASTSYDINVNTSQAVRAIKDLNAALTTLATGAVITGFTNLIDSAARLQNKLSLVAVESQTTAQTFGLMIQSANKLGVPLSQLSDLYSSISQNTKDLGMSQAEQLKLTENLTKGFVMSGLSAAGASAAVLQLGQSFAKGGPQAEEMTTIIEQLPLVAEQLSKKLGVTTGALKYMASQGKISSQDLVDASNKAGEAMDKAYRDRIVTVSESVNVFNNVLTALADKLNKDEQFSTKLGGAILAMAEGIIAISEFFKEWGSTIVTVIEVLAAILIPIRLATIAVGLFETAALGVGRGLSTISSVASGFGATLDKIKVWIIGITQAFFPALQTVPAILTAFSASIVGFFGMQDLFARFHEWWNGITNDSNKKNVEELNKAVGATSKASEDAAEAAKKLKNQFDMINAENVEKASKALAQSFSDVKSNLRLDTAGTILGEEQKGKLQIQTDAAKKYSDAILKIQESYEKNKGANFAKDQAKEVEKLTEQYQSELNTVNQLYDAKLQAQHADEFRKYSLQEQYKVQDKLKSLQDDINKTTMPEAQRKYYDLKVAADEAAKAEIRAAAERRGIKVEDMPVAEVQAYYDAANKGVDELAKKTAELNAVQEKETLRVFALKEQYKVQDDLKNLQDEINKSTMTTAERKYYDIKTAADEAAKAEIRAAAERQNIKVEDLPVEQVKAYYDAANKGVSELIAKQNELNAVQEKENLRLFNLKEQYQVQDDLKRLQDDINQSTMTELEKKYDNIRIAADESAKSEIRAAAARQNIKVQDMPTDQVKAYYDAAYQGVERLKTATTEQYNKSREFSTGWKQAMNAYVTDVTNAAKQAEAIFQKATQGMEDMIVNFAKTGKFEWKSFVASMLEELLRSQIKQQIASIFGMGAGNTNASSAGGGLLGMLGFANGGLIPTNGPVLVGERGPEIIAGAAGRTVIPNHELGQATGMTNITYNISAVDAMSFKQMIAADPNFIYAVTQQGAKSMPGVR